MQPARLCSLTMLLISLLAAPPLMAGTLQNALKHGDIRCGVFPDDPGRSAINTDGRWAGFYVDFCKATAAALFGDPSRVQYIEVDANSRFTSLQERQTDVVMYSTTWTLGREDTYQVSFPAVYLFDGQGLIVRKDSGIHKIEDLSGHTVCATENTTTYRNMANLLKERGINARLKYANGDSFFRGHCDAYSADRMNLATNRANRAENPDLYRILPETFSREPIAPMVRDDDPQWARLIAAVVHGLILADEHGITAANIEEMRATHKHGEIANFLGTNGQFGQHLGLPQDWAVNMIQSVGNYSEIYARHYGPDTPIGIPAGLNQPWSRGGLLYAPLFR